MGHAITGMNIHNIDYLKRITVLILIMLSFLMVFSCVLPLRNQPGYQAVLVIHHYDLKIGEVLEILLLERGYYFYSESEIASAPVYQYRKSFTINSQSKDVDTEICVSYSIESYEGEEEVDELSILIDNYLYGRNEIVRKEIESLAKYLYEGLRPFVGDEGIEISIGKYALGVF